MATIEDLVNAHLQKNTKFILVQIMFFLLIICIINAVILTMAFLYFSRKSPWCVYSDSRNITLQNVSIKFQSDS